MTGISVIYNSSNDGALHSQPLFSELFGEPADAKPLMAVQTDLLRDKVGAMAHSSDPATQTAYLQNLLAASTLQKIAVEPVAYNLPGYAAKLGKMLATDGVAFWQRDRITVDTAIVAAEILHREHERLAALDMAASVVAADTPAAPAEAAKKRIKSGNNGRLRQPIDVTKITDAGMLAVAAQWNDMLDTSAIADSLGVSVKDVCNLAAALKRSPTHVPQRFSVNAAGATTRRPAGLRRTRMASRQALGKASDQAVADGATHEVASDVIENAADNLAAVTTPAKPPLFDRSKQVIGPDGKPQRTPFETELMRWMDHGVTKNFARDWNEGMPARDLYKKYEIPTEAADVPIGMALTFSDPKAAIYWTVHKLRRDPTIEMTKKRPILTLKSRPGELARR